MQINFEFEESEKSKADAIREAIKPARGGGRKSLREMELSVLNINIPDDEILFQKQYYTIGEVAKMFGEKNSLLRYWEKEFKILNPRKNKKGDRYFRPEDIKLLKLIHHLLRERKYTIDGAKDFLKYGREPGAHQKLVESLEKLKLFLLELKNNL